MADRVSEVEARDKRRVELVEIVRRYGVCPDKDACVRPNPDLEDCRGCLMAWAALKSLEMGE